MSLINKSVPFKSETERHKRYAQFLREAIPEGEWSLIRAALQRGQLTGTERFVDEIEQVVGRRIEHCAPGRPRKEGQDEPNK